MSDLEFMRRAKAADFVQKTWDMVMTARGQIDNVTCSWRLSLC
jgi:hypothetical protein